MFKITQTEAAETMATEIRVWARKAGRTEVTKTLVEERISEIRDRWERGDRSYLAQSAHQANVTTTLRAATRWVL